MVVNHGFMYADTNVKYAYGGSHRRRRTTLWVQVEELRLMAPNPIFIAPQM